MRKGRFNKEQMVAIVREANRTSAAEAKKNKVSEPTIYPWRKHFGQMDAVDVKRLRVLEAENARLKKLLAVAALGIEVLSEINEKNVVVDTLLFLVLLAHQCAEKPKLISRAAWMLESAKPLQSAVQRSHEGRQKRREHPTKALDRHDWPPDHIRRFCVLYEQAEADGGDRYVGSLLVPRQTGTRRQCLPAGQQQARRAYLRTLLMHGARSIVRSERSASWPWLSKLLKRRPYNVDFAASSMFRQVPRRRIPGPEGFTDCTTGRIYD